MIIKDLIENGKFHVCCIADESRLVRKILCSDIHSYALERLNEDDIWITVSAHINTLAVAKRKNISCVILADGMKPDNDFLRLAEEHGVSTLISTEPVYETALIIGDIKKKR